MALGKKLDEIDIKIIKDLLRDGRKSFAAIAKECNVSKTTIGEHYKKLEEAGIIVGATLQTNCSIEGARGVATLLITVESHHIEKVIERIRKIPKVNVQRQYNANYNILVIASCNNSKELAAVKENISRNNSVIECRTYMWTDVRNTPENIIHHPKNAHDKDTQTIDDAVFTSKKHPVEIDEIDIQIIDKLEKNGRVSFMKIGQEMGIATDTVSRRYKKLVENRLIKSSIQINPKMLGYQAVADFRLEFTVKEEIDSLIEKIRQIPDISYIVKGEGAFDLHIAALTKDIDHVFSINDQISQIPHIKKLEVALRKTLYAWPSPGQHISTFGKKIGE